MNAPAIGAALRYTEDQLGGPCTEQDSFPVAVTTGPIQILGNADRVGLVVMNLGANNVFMSLQAGVGSTSGFLLAPAGGVAAFAVRDDFTLPSRTWNLISTVGGSQLYVLELIRFQLNPASK